MAIRIYSAHVAQSLVTKVLCALLLLAPFAAEAQEFFEKNYAREMVEPETGSHPAFGPASGSKKNGRKMKSYEEYVTERREQKEAELAEKAKNQKANEDSSKPINTSANTLPSSVEDKSSINSEEPSTTEDNSSSALPFEPIDAEAKGGVTLDIILSTSPAEHFFSELRRIPAVSKIKGVTLGDVYAVGKPPLVPEFVEALKEFHKTKKKIKFEMVPPHNLKVEYSPVWIVTVGGRKLVFEGEFGINEIFISNKSR